MTIMSLLMLVLGCGFGAGLLVVIGAVTRVLGPEDSAAHPSSRPRRSIRRGRLNTRTGARLLGGVLVGVTGWWITGWPIAALLITTLIMGVPWLFGAGKVAEQRINRIAALASWCRRLRDMVATGQTTLSQAIRESAATAPAPIAAEVGELVQRMRSWEFAAAARLFADEIDDHVGDQIAAALIIAYQQGAGVSRLLSGLAASVDVEVAARRDIEAQRAGPRKTARILVVIYLALLAALATNGTYLAPYNGVLGQLVMAALSAVVLGSLIWLRTLSLSASPPRFLVGPSQARPAPGPLTATPVDDDIVAGAASTQRGSL